MRGGAGPPDSLSQIEEDNTGTAGVFSKLHGKRARFSRGGKKKGGPFDEFLLGCFLIAFALPMVWMNERK